MTPADKRLKDQNASSAPLRRFRYGYRHRPRGPRRLLRVRDAARGHERAASACAAPAPHLGLRAGPRALRPAPAGGRLQDVPDDRLGPLVPWAGAELPRGHRLSHRGPGEEAAPVDAPVHRAGRRHLARVPALAAQPAERRQVDRQRVHRAARSQRRADPLIAAYLHDSSRTGWQPPQVDPRGRPPRPRKHRHAGAAEEDEQLGAVGRSQPPGHHGPRRRRAALRAVQLGMAPPGLRSRGH